jgi:colicin import membrane protein
MKQPLALVLLLLAAWPALAADAEAQRARITQERTVAEARFAAQQKDCRGRFAVNDCVQKATRERNASLAELRRQERELDAAERKQRAAERQRELDERRAQQEQDQAQRRAKGQAEQRDREQRAAEKAAKNTAKETGQAAQAPARGDPAPKGKPRTAGAPASHGPSAAEADKNRAAYEARLKEAEQHKAEVAARNAKRAKPLAADLPPPR